MKTYWHILFPFCIFGIIACAKDKPISVGPQVLDIAVSKSVFAIIGDYGEDGNPELQVSEMVESWQPDFIITTGDNNYPRGELSTVQNNIGKYYCDYIYNPDAPPGFQCQGRAANDKTNYFFPTPGNHDYGDSSNINAYLNYFTLPGTEQDYEFTWGPVHFYSIDSGKYGSGIAEGTKEWLRKKLAAAEQPFKLVFFHHPPYSSGQHGNSPDMQWDFAGWGATAVLNGHDHTYEHIVEKSVPDFHYFVNGLGGRTPLYHCNDNPIDTSKFNTFCYDENYGAIKVTATPNTLTFSLFSIENGGTLIDEVLISK